MPPAVQVPPKKKIATMNHFSQHFWKTLRNPYNISFTLCQSYHTIAIWQLFENVFGHMWDRFYMKYCSQAFVKDFTRTLPQHFPDFNLWNETQPIRKSSKRFKTKPDNDDTMHINCNAMAIYPHNTCSILHDYYWKYPK